MKTVLLSLLLCAAASAAEPRLSRERVVLRTALGELTVALYPDAAPKHAARFLELARSGAYDGTWVFKVAPGRVIHVTGIGRRRAALPADRLVLPRLAPEVGGAPHRYGTLSFARDPSDPDATGTSFVILLAAIPAMDGRFTAFGQVVGGREVLAAIGAESGARVDIESASVVDDAPAPSSRAAAFAALLMAGGFLLSRVKVRFAASGGLLTLLTGFFLLFAALAPAASGSRWLGFALLAGAIAVFRLMTRFEDRAG